MFENFNHDVLLCKFVKHYQNILALDPCPLHFGMCSTHKSSPVGVTMPNVVAIRQILLACIWDRHTDSWYKEQYVNQ